MVTSSFDGYRDDRCGWFATIWKHSYYTIKSLLKNDVEREKDVNTALRSKAVSLHRKESFTTWWAMLWYVLITSSLETTSLMSHWLTSKYSTNMMWYRGNISMSVQLWFLKYDTWAQGKNFVFAYKVTLEYLLRLTYLVQIKRSPWWLEA